MFLIYRLCSVFIFSGRESCIESNSLDTLVLNEKTTEESFCSISFSVKVYLSFTLIYGLDVWFQFI